MKFEVFSKQSAPPTEWRLEVSDCLSLINPTAYGGIKNAE